MIKLTQKQWSSIHRDYRGLTENGKRSAFNGSLRAAAGLTGWGNRGGTDLLIEGIHFEVSPYTRKQYMAHECTHAQYNDQFVTDAHRARVASSIGISRIKSSKDKYFNDIPLKNWDRIGITSDISTKMKAAGDYLTEAGAVCIHKAAARQIRDRMPTVKVTTESGHTWETAMGSAVTEEAAKAYFVGNVFDIGVYPEERMEKVVSVEYSL